MSDKPLPNCYVMLYSQLLPKLREAARAKGYALGLHGSMQNDLDIMAMPWVEEAASPLEVMQALCAACGGFVVGRDLKGVWTPQEPVAGTPRPHGRETWNLAFGGKAFVDVSFMPRKETV